ncbi:MAG: TonB-dependent receptor plug [Bacteroidetes bacterium]|nr:TonB-dependent receptor plug [Bacteroidota bacterium]
MFLRKLLILLLSVFSVVSSFSQTGVLRGKITEAGSKELLPGAAVQLVNNLTKGTVSDMDGNYSLVLDTGNYLLFCAYIGYVNDTFSVHIQTDAITEKNIDLLTAAKFLETIVVSSGKFDQKIEEMTVSMEVIKPKLITGKNTTSIETALEQVPGLTIIDNDPQIRGGSGFTFGVGSRVAIVVDGIPLLSGDAGRPEWSYIPVENVEQIEIIKGASSVLYGSSALSGVINVRSAYPRSTPKTVINYSVGSYSMPDAPAENWYGSSLPGFTNLNFLHSRIIKNNLDFVVGGNFNIDQGYIGPPPPQPPIPEYARDEFDTIHTFTNQDMLKVRGRLNFNLRYRSKKHVGLNYGINANGMLNKTNMVLAWFNDSTGLYKGYPGAVFLENQAIFNLDPFIKYSKNGVSHSLVTRLFHTDNVITNNQSNRGTLYYGEYQLQRIFKNLDFTFTGGIVGSLSESHAQLYKSSGSPNNRIANASGYAQIDKKFWKILNLSGGFRYEYFKMNTQQSVVAPIFRAGASLQLMKATYVRASYGQGFRYPTITERYISTRAGLFGVYPNPDLKPETSNNFEVGLKQGFKIGKLAGYFDIAGFYQRYKNTIEYLFGVWDPSSSLVVGFKFLNTGESQVRGVDMSLVAATPETNKRLGITALIGYTYVEPVSLTPDFVYGHDHSFGGAGRDLSYANSSMDTTGNIMKYRFKHMVKADVEFKVYRFTFGVSYKYYSRMQNIDKAFEDVEQLTAALDFIDDIKVVNYWKTHNGYSLFDARIGYNINKKSKIAIVCNNVFNVDYSLRPLKIESPRTIALQYVCTF